MTYEQYIEHLRVYFKEKLQLQHWIVDMDLDYRFDGEILGMANIQLEYLDIRIDLSRKLRDKFKKGEYKVIMEIVLHEFCHIFTEKLYRLAVDAMTNTSMKFLEAERETMTSHLAHIYAATVPKEIYDVKSNSKRTTGSGTRKPGASKRRKRT